MEAISAFPFRLSLSKHGPLPREMMMQSRYRFFLVVSDAARDVVYREEVSDFSSCYEDLLFAGVCAGKVVNDGTLPAAAVEPVWRDEKEGKVAGVVVSLPLLSKHYELTIFADRVWEALVNRELIKGDGQEEEQKARRFIWRVEAHKREAERKGKLRISLSRQPYPLVHCSLSAFGIGSAPREEGPVSLFLSRSLLAELREETVRSLDTERADILTGHLVQEAGGQVALVVIGRIPVQTETAASLVHFSFSPLSFLTAQKEVARRPSGETIIGWHHNHPPPCAGNCLQYIPPCQTSTVFFSTADRSVHRASFPAPYMIALVSGKEAGRRADDPGLQAYGWQDGVMQQREFFSFEGGMHGG